jgi:MFS family permease
MASLMIPGARLSDVWGTRRTFTLGISLYGTGALITALSPNLTVMIIGWSVLEGVGSALMIPAILTLIPHLFSSGDKRVRAFAIIGAVAAAGAAVGPMVCGVISTYLTWRVSFAAEVAVVLVVLAMHARIKHKPATRKRAKFDFLGAVLSALGFALVAFGIMQANRIETNGWIPLIALTASGLIVLLLFGLWQVSRKRAGKPLLVNLAIFKSRTIRVGLTLNALQSFMLSGAAFILPVFQQLALGYSPLMSGLTILPETVGIIVVSQIAGRLVPRFGRKAFSVLGTLLASSGILLAAVVIDVYSSFWEFIPPALVIGAGIGMLSAPLLDTIQSAVPPKLESEVSGVNKSAGHLGGSLGTAVAGAVLIAVLISGLTGLVSKSALLPSSAKAKLERAARADARTLSDTQVRARLKSMGAPERYMGELVKINAEARDHALQVALTVVGVIGLFGFALSFRLPKDRPVSASRESVQETASA